MATDDEAAEAQAAILPALPAAARRPADAGASAAVAHPTDTLLAEDLADSDPADRAGIGATRANARERGAQASRRRDERRVAAPRRWRRSPMTLHRAFHRSRGAGARGDGIRIRSRVAAANAVLPVMAEATEAIVVLWSTRTIRTN
jgi:hypothetical protein